MRGAASDFEEVSHVGMLPETSDQEFISNDLKIMLGDKSFCILIKTMKIYMIVKYNIRFYNKGIINYREMKKLIKPLFREDQKNSRKLFMSIMRSRENSRRANSWFCRNLAELKRNPHFL